MRSSATSGCSLKLLLPHLQILSIRLWKSLLRTGSEPYKPLCREPQETEKSHSFCKAQLRLYKIVDKKKRVAGQFAVKYKKRQEHW
jgi:hypothetical protein